jgi:hypothetical protein
MFLSGFQRGGERLENLGIVAALALLASVLTLALVREVRLRRALEALLRRILTTWRKLHAPNDSDSRRPAARDRDHPDERL